MNTNTNAQRAYVEAIISRLHRQYDEQTPLPTKEDSEQGEPLSAVLLQRLYRHIISEGYGE